MPLYVGAQNTSTTVGAPVLELVNHTTVGSSVSGVSFTGLEDETVYRIIGKYIKLSGDHWVKIHLLDTSGAHLTGTDNNLTYRRDGTSAGIWDDGDELNCWMPNSSVVGCVIDFQTKLDHTWLLGHFHNSMNNGSAIISASIEQASSDRIGGIKFWNGNGGGSTIESGSEILLYKYKES
jgi:hypothetical protein